MRLRKILMVASVTFACVAQAQDLQGRRIKYFIR